MPSSVYSYVVGLDPLPGLEQDSAVTILDRTSRVVLLRVVSMEAPRIRRLFSTAAHVYENEENARRVWALFAGH